MSFAAKIERVNGLDIVTIGIGGFDYSKVKENAEVTAMSVTPTGQKFNILSHILAEEEFSFNVPFRHLYGPDGVPVTNNHDSIRTFGSQELVGARKIVAGIVHIDYLGTNPKKQPMVGIQKILDAMGNPLQNRWDDEEQEEEFESGTYSWEEIACTVEELPDGLSVLRFNFNGENISNLREQDLVKNVSEFTTATFSEIGIK